jgi:hypothetical protein
MLRKKIFFPVLALAIIAGALATSNFVSAQDTEQGPSPLIQKIAKKFNLNEADVKAVFDEEMNERHSQMKQRMEEKLDQAVKDGKINDAQKSAILEKLGQPFTVKFKADMSDKQNREDMIKLKEEKKAEMETWLSQNGLTHELLREIMGHPKGFGGKKVMLMAH